jgi:hypothetical protein
MSKVLMGSTSSFRPAFSARRRVAQVLDQGAAQLGAGTPAGALPARQLSWRTPSAPA